MDSILWHPRTRDRIDAFLAAPSHALLLHGVAGSGKKKMADVVLGELINESSPYITKITPINNSISIEEIRQLEKLLTLKIPNKQSINRLIVIYNADTMTHEAQNALLKSIEEPPVGTVFILTADDKAQLLQTIQSRVVSIPVAVPSVKQLAEYLLNQGYQKSAVDKALLQSGGLPGLTIALLQNNEHPLIVAAENAKILLSGSRFEKLCIVDSLSKNKIDTIHTLHVMQRIAHIQLPKSNGKATMQWIRVSENAYNALKMLSKNAQPKIVLDYLCLHA